MSKCLCKIYLCPESSLEERKRKYGIKRKHFYRFSSPNPCVDLTSETSSESNSDVLELISKKQRAKLAKKLLSEYSSQQIPSSNEGRAKKVQGKDAELGKCSYHHPHHTRNLHRRVSYCGRYFNWGRSQSRSRDRAHDLSRSRSRSRGRRDRSESRSQTETGDARCYSL